MDCAQIGTFICKLRKEKGLTQNRLAVALHISAKTVSKWECGMGYPDLSLWPELSEVLGVDIGKMMVGELSPNKPDIGKMDHVLFYVCPICGNILVSTGNASISCCGRKLKALPLQPDSDDHKVKIQEMDNYYYVTIDHKMEKTHYITFVAYVEMDKILLNRLYPEQTAAVQIPMMMHGGRLYLYCSQHGLFTAAFFDHNERKGVLLSRQV